MTVEVEPLTEPPLRPIAAPTRGGSALSRVWVERFSNSTSSDDVRIAVAAEGSRIATGMTAPMTTGREVVVSPSVNAVSA